MKLLELDDRRPEMVRMRVKFWFRKPVWIYSLHEPLDSPVELNAYYRWYYETGGRLDVRDEVKAHHIWRVEENDRIEANQEREAQQRYSELLAAPTKGYRR